MRPEKPRTSSFGLYLWERRRYQGYTVTGLAQMAGVSPSTVSDLEQGKRRLTGGMARRLAGPLDLTPNELLVRANVTPEFPWGQTLQTPTEQLRDLVLFVTEEEQRRIQDYLDFLRFRDLVSFLRDNSGSH